MPTTDDKAWIAPGVQRDHKVKFHLTAFYLPYILMTNQPSAQICFVQLVALTTRGSFSQSMLLHVLLADKCEEGEENEGK